ncbi:MAG: SOS response-associated peptidase [Acidobacteria bacterium]|nr:SOS response-associated peptidase [Acidobacteriota bacterium]
MCGRYFRRSEKQAIAERFRVGKVLEEPMLADYNVAPTTMQPVVRLGRDSGEREMALLRWGMVPFFAGSLREFKGLTTFVARAETAAGSATWREPLRKRRCLVPMDGYYEWAMKPAGARVVPPGRRTAKPSRGGKQPYAVTLKDGGMMAIAGLWDAWREPKKSPQEVDRWLQSFAMVTVPANGLLAPICERMPVILHERDWDEWLSRDEAEEPPMHLLQPYEAEGMVAEVCNTAVGNVRNNGPEMLVG